MGDKPAEKGKELEEPLVGSAPAPQSSVSKCCSYFSYETKKKTAMYGCGCCGVVGLVIAILQGICFYYATLFCGRRMEQGYNFPGGQDGPMGTARTNMVPRIAILTQNEGQWYRDGYAEIPSNEASTPAAAQVGVWYKYWGPWFSIYVYQDQANSYPTIYARRNLLRIGASWSVERCDMLDSDSNQNATCHSRTVNDATHNTGATEVCKEGHEHFYQRVEVNEGSNYIGNKWRKLVGSTQGTKYDVYLGPELAAFAEILHSDTASITFRTPDHAQTELASAVLKDRNWHNTGRMAWLVKSSRDSTMPYYIPNAVAMLYAFGYTPPKHHSGASTRIPTFLAESPPIADAVTGLKIANATVPTAQGTERVLLT